MKKLVSLVLALALVLGLASFTVGNAEGEIVKLTWLQNGSPAPIDNDIVLEELNKISREEVGVECDIIYMSHDEASLSVQSGDLYDMYYTDHGYLQYNMYVANGFFANIDGKVQEWTPDLYAIMPENVWDMSRVNGGLYSIPVNKDYAPMQFMGYDAQFALDNGFDIPDVIESWDEMTPYLEALQAAMNEDPSLGTYAMPLAGGTGACYSGVDRIDSIAQIACEFGKTTVQSEFTMDVVMDHFRTLRKWYTMGLINPDAPTASSVDTAHGMGFIQAWTGYDWTPGRGHWTKLVRFDGPNLNPQGIQGAMNAFSVTLEEDEPRFKKAMEYQQLVNCNKTYRDILAFGIEGTHFDYYDVTDDETGEVLGQVAIRTELGKSNYSPASYTQGNYVARSIEANIGMVDGTYPKPVLNQWELYFNDVATQAVETAIGGFQFDPSAFENEYAQFTAIKGEYQNDLHSGAVDPDEKVPEMMDRLYAAGYQDVIDECQRQLDEFLANK